MMDNKNELLVRVYFVMVLFVIIAFLILGRVIMITMVEGDDWRNRGTVNLKWIDNDVDRGDILDRHGNLLATSLPYFDIRMDLLAPKESLFIKNIDSLALCLAKMWPNRKSASEWESELIQKRVAGSKGRVKGARYHYIANNLNHEQLKKLKTFPIFNKGQNRGGLIVERKSKREKPFRDIASRTIGEDRNNSDKIGIEGSFDHFLRGKVDKQLYKRLGANTWIPVNNPENFIPKKGNDIVTTLDMHLQDIVQLELKRGLKSQKARSGTAILMEVETGAIRAIANLKKSDNDDFQEDYNYGLGWLSEPGSTMKAASMLALLESGCASLNQEIEVNGGKMNFYGEWMYDSEQHYKDKMTLAEAFKLSSNVGISSIANKCFKGPSGVAEFVDYFYQFGLHEKTGIEIQGEGEPFVKNPVDNKDQFWKTTVPWMSHGYEMHLTPLQILTFYNAIANDGKKMKPYLVERVKDEDEIVHSFYPKVMTDTIAALENVLKLQDLLKGVVLSGTAKRLKSDEFTFAGKTGTTRVGYNKETESKEYNASFAGYFPADNPKYSMIVVVYNPKVAFYGGHVAGPIFRNVVERCHSLVSENESLAENRDLKDFNLDSANLGYGPDYNDLLTYMDVEVEDYQKSNWVKVDSESGSAKLTKNKIVKNQVPDVTGMGLRDATYVLESLGMRVSSDGVGKVVKQSINPNVKVQKQEINLILK